VIGQVGESSKGVEAMLTRVGFRYAERVDPFDGGPHFIAGTDEILTNSGTKTLPFLGPGTQLEHTALVACFTPEAPFMRAVKTPCHLTVDGIALPNAMAERLGVAPGDTLTCTTQG
jgi:arginine N-succinyltransferase